MREILEIPLKGERKTKKNIQYYITDNGCWEIISHRAKGSRYGVININGKVCKLHRYIYECFIGKIPDGMVIRHKCDNTFCINPDHLEIGTQQDNIRDTVLRGRTPVGNRMPQAKLTEDIVRKIRKENSLTYYQIADKYGIHHSTAWLIKNRKRWKHVS